PSKGGVTADPATPTADGKQPDAVTPALVTAKPRGYLIVASGAVSSPAHTQRYRQVLCPQPLLPLGGGGFVQSTSTAVDVNSSFPVGLGWEADVNNNSGSPTTFTVYAICGNEPKHYDGDLDSFPFDVPAFSQIANIDGACAIGSGKPLSGGQFSDSTSLLANM